MSRRSVGAALLALALVAGGYALGRGSGEHSAPPPAPTPTPQPAEPTATLEGIPCGGPLPKADGGTWVCTFADEFVGAEVDRAKWQVLTTGASAYTNGGECYVDSPRNVSVSGGELHLTLRLEEQDIPCPGLPHSPTTRFTAGMLTSSERFAQAYGRFEIRARFPTADGPGLHSALWLWPQNHDKYGPRPASGEIDIAEFFTAYPDRVIPFLHYVEAFAGQQVTSTDCLVEAPDTFHTYTLEWTPTSMTIAYDGKTCLSTTWQARGLVHPAPFDMPFFVNLTQALGKAPNAPADDLPLPATMDVDYVRVWS